MSSTGTDSAHAERRPPRRSSDDIDRLRLVLLRLARRIRTNSAGQITPSQLEVAVLDRTRSQSRKFKRLAAERLIELLPSGG